MRGIGLFHSKEWNNLDLYRPVVDVIFEQLLGLFSSLHMGFKPDASSSNGAISRVVQAIEIHQHTKGQTMRALLADCGNKSRSKRSEGSISQPSCPVIAQLFLGAACASAMRLAQNGKGYREWRRHSGPFTSFQCLFFAGSKIPGTVPPAENASVFQLLRGQF